LNHHFYINLFVSIAILDIRVIQGRLEAADLPQNQDVTQTPLTTDQRLDSSAILARSSGLPTDKQRNSEQEPQIPSPGPTVPPTKEAEVIDLTDSEDELGRFSPQYLISEGEDNNAVEVTTLSD